MARPPREGALPEHVLFHPQVDPGRIPLAESESVHALKSLRLRLDDPVVVTDGRGRWGLGHIAAVGKKRVEVLIESTEERRAWPSRQVWLGMGVLKSQRMDVVLEKASELGVARFFPLVLKRSVARPNPGGAKDERWHRIALESLKQSRRSHLMEVEGPGELDGFLANLPSTRALWVADPGGSDPGRASVEPAAGPLVLVVGPEGGLDSGELDALVQAGGQSICLGSNRLRAETAGVTLVVAALGRLGALSAGYE